jgi:8-oxo-dGTP diphosphatase
VKEESGLTVLDPSMKGFLTFPKFSKNEDWYAFLFVIEDFHGRLIDSPEGNLQWIDDDRLFELNLWEGDRIFLEWLKQDRFFSGRFIYEDGALVDHHVVFHGNQGDTC